MPPAPGPAPRQRADLATLVAISHPLRRRLLELLSVGGPATASQLAARTEQLVGNVSHHLKMLAKAAMIEEAPELAKNRRERWWRSVPGSLSYSLADVAGDPEAELVVAAAEQQNVSHEIDKLHAWWARRDSYDAQWLDAEFGTSSWVRATPAELRELGEAITTLIHDFRATTADDDGQRREPVFVFAHGVPARP